MIWREPNSGLDRVRHALHAKPGGPKGSGPVRTGIHSRGDLPHIKRENAWYLVTFRLADSLPRQVLLQFQKDRADRLARLGSDSPEGLAEVRRNANLEYFRQIERYIDRGVGGCLLARPEIAELVANAMRHFEGQRYRLDAWVVMPNHAHAVVWPQRGESLSKILKSWKGYTAREGNKVLDRVGEEFWQRESFDHWIRDETEHARCCRYVISNPVKAGLCANPEDWRWSSARRG